MIDILKTYDLTTIQWILAIFCAMLIGMAKTGISGAGLAVVPILAAIMGSKPSTGLLLPMLIMGDIFAVSYYNRHARWKHVLRLMPWALIGIFLAAILGKILTSKLFNILLSISILSGVALMIWRDIKRDKTKIPDYWWFSALMGLAGGFTTMIGNAAGPIMALYLLSMHLPKNNFIGTAAWFFMIINIVKMPIQYFYWDNINLNSIVFDLAMFPAIVTGVIIGIVVVKKIPEKPYRILVISMTILAATILFFKNHDPGEETKNKNNSVGLLNTEQFN